MTQPDTLWTDGSSGVKSGKMGWAVVGFVSGRRIRNCGFGTGTNQVAELLAVLHAILSVPEGAKIHIVTDSMYAIGCCEDWRLKWKENGYISYNGNAISNYDIVLRCHSAYEARNVTFEHVRGHTGVPENELADSLCYLARLVGEGREDLAAPLANYLEDIE